MVLLVHNLLMVEKMIQHLFSHKNTITMMLLEHKQPLPHIPLQPLVLPVCGMTAYVVTLQLIAHEMLQLFWWRMKYEE